MKKGFPYIMFGDGHLASCKPISEADLASFMADCIEDEQKINQVLPIGGEQHPELLESVQRHICCYCCRGLDASGIWQYSVWFQFLA